MLTRLLVRDFLLVEEGVLEFGPAFNVLSGETGAGKSILLHALGLLRGSRGSAEWIRRPAEGLLVEGVFRTDPALCRRLRAAGIAAGEGDLVLTREIRKGGGNRCHANGQRILVEQLRRLSEPLIEIHGQREEERFRAPEAQRDLLDLFGGHGEMRRCVREAFRAAREGEAALAAHEERIAHLVREEDWTRFQLAEIERLAPAPGEDEELRERIGVLRRAGEKAELLELAEHILNGREGAVLESLEELDHRAAALDGAGEPWDGLRDQIRDLARRARRVYQELRRAGGASQTEVESLSALEARLDDLERLRRKHRSPLGEILALAERMRAALGELEAAQATGEALRRSAEEARGALAREASALGEARRKAGAALAEALREELEGIGMPDCRLRVGFAPPGAIGPAGAERVVFEVRTNPGEEFRPLGEIASGGEMARIALALRVVLGARGRAGLTVFDEIDAGLGGSAARAVAARLARVARHRQVLLVTHLPIIAAHAGRQIRVAKETREGRARVTVAAVEGEDRVEEIARMLAGEGSDPQARRHARAMLREPGGLPEPKGSARH